MAIIDIYWNATLYGKYSLVGIKDILLHDKINFSHTCFICRADEARCLQLPTPQYLSVDRESDLLQEMQAEE